MSKELTSSLTNKNRLFISNILKGSKIVDAYHEAGYKGDSDAAYALKYRLRNEISALVSSKATIDDTLLELENLGEMELMQKQITMNQKLRLIGLKLQALKLKSESQKADKPVNFTAFVIDRSTNEVKQGEVINAEVIDESTK